MATGAGTEPSSPRFLHLWHLPGICLGQSGGPSRTTSRSAPGGGIRDDLVQVSVRGAEKSGRWALAGGGLGRGRRVLRARARPVPSRRRGRREGDRTPLRAPALSRTPRPQETLVFQSEKLDVEVASGPGEGVARMSGAWDSARGARLETRGLRPGARGLRAHGKPRPLRKQPEQSRILESRVSGAQARSLEAECASVPEPGRRRARGLAE